MAQQQKLPDLPYDFNALEPSISAEIMQLHYSKHHQAYVNNLNAALEKYAAADAKSDISAMIELEPALRFNGGGHINHSIFWNNLAPPSKGGGGEPQGELRTMIDATFGSLLAFQELMTTKAVGIQGSGWCWLAYCKALKRLTIVTCANQDPCVTTGTQPLFGVDVWEHAYYMQYKSARADYVKNIWKVTHWKDVEKRLAAVKT